MGCSAGTDATGTKMPAGAGLKTDAVRVSPMPCAPCESHRWQNLEAGGRAFPQAPPSLLVGCGRSGSLPAQRPGARVPPAGCIIASCQGWREDPFCSFSLGYLMEPAQGCFMGFSAVQRGMTSHGHCLSPQAGLLARSPGASRCGTAAAPAASLLLWAALPRAGEFG